MEIKAGDLYQAKDALGRVGELKLPISKSYKVSKLIKKCFSELEIIEEKRVELVKRYGVPRKDNPDQYEIDQSKKSEYLKETQELGEILVTIDFEPMNIEEIFKTPSGEEAEITPSDIILLEPFFKDE